MADEQVCLRLRYVESVLQFTNDVICYNRTSEIELTTLSQANPSFSNLSSVFC